MLKVKIWPQESQWNPIKYIKTFILRIAFHIFAEQKQIPKIGFALLLPFCYPYKIPISSTAWQSTIYNKIKKTMILKYAKIVDKKKDEAMGLIDKFFDK